MIYCSTKVMLANRSFVLHREDEKDQRWWNIELEHCIHFIRSTIWLYLFDADLMIVYLDIFETVSHRKRRWRRRLIICLFSFCTNRFQYRMLFVSARYVLSHRTSTTWPLSFLIWWHWNETFDIAHWIDGWM